MTDRELSDDEMEKVRETVRASDKHTPYTDTEQWVAAIIRAAYRAGELAMRERAVAECMNAWPPAHTYASENADMYRAQDHVRDKIANAIDALSPKDAP